MARLNIVHMKGVIPAAPTILRQEDKAYLRGNILVGRGVRKVENGLKHMMTDKPYILTTEPEVIAQLENAKAWDIIDLKGTVTTRKIKKASYCTECGAKNVVDGILTFISPIFAEITGHCKNEDEAIQYLSSIRQVSNEVNVFGRLTRDPKKKNISYGLTVTQYQIALNRNYIIKDDPPELRADYPWVRSYGNAADEDHVRLKKDSIVFIDGFIQARNVNRHKECEACGKTYDWVDKSMEIVPYDTEYIRNFNSDEEIERIKQERLLQAQRDIGLHLKEQSKLKEMLNNLDDEDDF